jgi:adenosine deaminase
MVRKLFVIVLMAVGGYADEASTAARLESLRADPLLLRRFLEQMPKGGDLHQHLSGTVYAESYVQMAAKDNLCIDTAAMAYETCDEEGPHVPAAQALTDGVLHGRMIDALSMRQYRGDESGHDRFFGTFGRFGAISRNHTSEMLAEVVARFARENVDYIESLFGQDLGRARALGRQVQPGASFADMRAQLLQNGVPEVVAASRRTMDDADAHIRTALGCSGARPQTGCESTVRYLFETHRAFSREQLFAELLVGFELAMADSRVVGLNTVQREDSYGSMNGFDELMRMLAWLRPLYPSVRVSLHAGELEKGLVPPEGMQNHVRDSVLIAGAERIGHGVDIARERDALELLRTMAARPVAVEVCLTSSDVILGVRGKRHPLRLYLRSGVPVVLATDDPGVARSDMTTEWQRAVEEHGATYAELKRFARNSIEYSFLEGKSLFVNRDYDTRAEACREESSAACRSFLDANAKARVQMRLERRLREFENTELR